ncbi:hypothetical protein [Streptomyces sp. NBC_00268]|uniref:hypothetical protein n=1 Tax=Streptomyces sp. NBC_00268 TaxID=2975695 RepID=UPI002259D728|nr:hypothetical protein [Streptomyces sp. NBC_00268]MCX5189019.1 hypothetical protein [Streptomyces sp. NBC_00268]
MAIHPGMVEDLAASTCDLYEQAEERLLGIIARQLADGLDAPRVGGGDGDSHRDRRRRIRARRQLPARLVL